MGGLDPTKIFLILVIALIVVGPERLPGLARQLGGTWRELNRMREKFEAEVRAAVPDLDLPNIPTSPSRAITGYLTGLVSGQDSSVASAAPGVEEAVAEPAYGAAGAVSGRGRRVSRLTYADQEEAQSSWQPLLARQDSSSARRPPSMPSSSSSGSLAADTVFVFDEPSMN
ncbi:MAG: twin-arginine translocase TatA/TatE family subunit [Acidimicrobiales bacterium]|jgi:sec-independent protein translocase protein TatB